LAEQGFTLLGYDYSRVGLGVAAKLAQARGVNVDFRRLNLYDHRQVLTAGALRPRERAVDVLYARFLVEALEVEGRRNLWRFSRAVLRGSNGRIYLEFRTEAAEATANTGAADAAGATQPDAIAEELRGYGFTIEHSETNHGLAVHKEDDPRVCRIVAKMEAQR